MEDCLGKTVKVGDIICGCYSKRYNDLIFQKVIKITAKTVFVEPCKKKEFGCLPSQTKYTSSQILIVNDIVANK